MSFCQRGWVRFITSIAVILVAKGLSWLVPSVRAFFLSQVILDALAGVLFLPLSWGLPVVQLCRKSA
jgi:hypothetical protein